MTRQSNTGNDQTLETPDKSSARWSGPLALSWSGELAAIVFAEWRAGIAQGT